MLLLFFYRHILALSNVLPTGTSGYRNRKKTGEKREEKKENGQK